jgi:hypothetical protein
MKQGTTLDLAIPVKTMIRGDKSGSMGSSLFRLEALQCWNGHKYSMEDGFGITFLPIPATDPTPWLGRPWPLLITEQ